METSCTAMRDTAERITAFLRGLREETRCKGFVVGLSGGLDSAVVTKLAVDAVGGDNVSNIFMPTSSSPKGDSECTRRMSGAWGTSYREIDIQPVLDGIVGITGTTDRLDIGNIAARVRMTVLYNEARRKGYILLGTSNRSELMMGYFTKFGDGACDAMPIADLYKTQVRALAREIGIPEDVIEKPPTAGLWDGQTDEGDMGVEYAVLDVILEGIESGKDSASISEDLEVAIGDVQCIAQRVTEMAHKRSLPKRP